MNQEPQQATDDRHFMGLDLGKSQDFTALVGVRQREHIDPEHPNLRLWRYEVRGVKRWALRTPYTAIAGDVAKITSKPPLAGSMLGIDGTGVGNGVIEIIRTAEPNAQIRAVLITGGQSAGRSDDGWHIAKVELIGCVVGLLDSGRLDIPRTVEHAETLADELRNFRMRVSAAGNETFDSWRDRDHDDILLGLAIAVWLGEQTPMWEPPEPLDPPRRNLSQRYAERMAGGNDRDRPDDHGQGQRRGIFGQRGW